MAKGTVKWFNNAKGYGFIIPDDGKDDLFVHYTYIEMEGYRTLKAGQRVAYDTQEAPKGLHAVNISIIMQDSDSSSESLGIAPKTTEVQDIPVNKPIESQGPTPQVVETA